MRIRETRRVYHFVVIAGLVAGVALVSSVPASALAVYDVTSLTDGAAGSLRDAIDSANGDGDESEINLPADANIVLDVCGALTDENLNVSGDLDVTADDALTINGNGSTITQTCDGQRVVHVLGAADVQLWELTITGGDVTVGTGAGNGGGVSLENDAGSLLIALSSIVGNAAASVGGGIHADVGPRTLSVFDSTISGNSAEFGGGISGGSPLIVNSTISGNSVLEEGGAVLGTAELIYVTIVGNDAGTGHLPGQIGDDITVWGSVIGASSDGGRNCAASVATLSGGYNVEDGDDCGLIDPTDQVDTDPMLGPLADNGGATLTQLPGAGSPLVGNIPTDQCDLAYVADQRNVARPQRDGCDTGSVEVEPDESTPPPDETVPTRQDTSTAVNPRLTG